MVKSYTFGREDEAREAARGNGWLKAIDLDAKYTFSFEYRSAGSDEWKRHTVVVDSDEATRLLGMDEAEIVRFWAAHPLTPEEVRRVVLTMGEAPKEWIAPQGINLEAVRALVEKIEDGTLHHGECSGVQSEGFNLSDCNCPLASILGAMRSLLAEVERLRDLVRISESAIERDGREIQRLVAEDENRCEFCGGVHYRSTLQLLDVPVITCPNAPPGFTVRRRQ